MENDEAIEIANEFEENEWEENDDGEGVVADDAPEVKMEVKPELKRLYQQHPECNLDYVEQVAPKIPLQVVPPGGGKVDPNHRTYPFLTVFEKTKIIGLRANQLSKGAVPYVAVPKHLTDVREIARYELEQKRLPFIVKRPLPNGAFEYWRLNDLILL
jgi:DNA-directed RNA polymerase subunit K/omega